MNQVSEIHDDVQLNVKDEQQMQDAQDPLRDLRELFVLPDGVIYLDGNSLGALPKATADIVAKVVSVQWGQGLIKSWNDAGWIEMPHRVGDKIASLIGARQGEIICADSTSVNLFKVLHAALMLAKQSPHDAQKRIVLSERENFPTDLYIAQSLCKQHGFELKLVDAHQLQAELANGDRIAVLMLTHVHYRSGAVHDMLLLTKAAHAVGALTVWDLAHSAGALPVDLHASNVDFAVGCGYKYLNGGPGAPAFAWAHPRHANVMEQPLNGWMGHAAPFVFTPEYVPAEGSHRLLCGTPPIISMAALECGVDTLLAAKPLGGIHALRKKSLALSNLFIELVDKTCAGFGLSLLSPREDLKRGSQVSYTFESIDGYAVMQALIARGVIGDFRAGYKSVDGVMASPDILRFGFAPLYIRFVDVHRAVNHLREVLEGKEWKQSRFKNRSIVT